MNNIKNVILKIQSATLDILRTITKFFTILSFREPNRTGKLCKAQNEKARLFASFCEMTATGKRTAFTLAEALITVITIGIIAILVLPSFNAGISQTALDSQKKSFYGRFNQALHRMRIDGTLSQGYATTIDFVNALSKYIRIGQICDSDNIKKCFQKPITTTDGTTLYPEILNSTTALQGGIFNSDLVGMKFADGTSAIIGYNPDCRFTAIYDIGADVTQCLIMIYDVNSDKEPNVLKADRETINLNEDNLGWDIERITFSALNSTQCEDAQKAQVPIKHCGKYEQDYWAGAAKACHDMGKKLPSPEEFAQIASQLYGQPLYVTAGRVDNIKVVDEQLWKKLAITGETGFWASANEYKESTQLRTFGRDRTSWGSHLRNASFVSAICINK